MKAERLLKKATEYGRVRTIPASISERPFHPGATMRNAEPDSGYVAIVRVLAKDVRVRLYADDRKSPIGWGDIPRPDIEPPPEEIPAIDNPKGVEFDTFGIGSRVVTMRLSDLKEAFEVFMDSEVPIRGAEQ